MTVGSVVAKKIHAQHQTALAQKAQEETQAAAKQSATPETKSASHLGQHIDQKV